MHTLQTIAAISGFMLLTSACSSELDEAKPMPLGTTGSDAAFAYYDMDQDLVVSAHEIYQREKSCGATAITSQSAAEQIMGEYDFDESTHLDHLEFAGLVNPRTLACALTYPEWTNARPRR